jgi:hypothetical protein
MRANEFTVDEAATGPAFKEIVAHLKSLGYTHVGSGADARVWAKDTSHVIKILMPDDPSGHAERVFKKFYEFCESHPDISCLPVFNEMNTIDLAGEDYIQIDMEHLQPIKKGSLQESMVWILSDYAITGETWQQILPSLTDPTFWGDFMSDSKASIIAKLINNEIAKNGVNFHKTYATLFTVMKLLYQSGRINKFGWDLHTENVMQRSNGELVIIDPWFADSNGSL